MVADAIAVTLIGWFVTPFITKFINSALEYINEKNKSLKDVNPKLKQLAGHLGGINMVVQKVWLCFIKNGTKDVVNLLWELKGAIDEAEDILDLFEYESLKKNGISSKFAEKFTGPKDSASRLVKVVEKLGQLLDSARVFLPNSENTIHVSHIFHLGRETGPSPSGNAFFGYDRKHNELKKLLKGQHNMVIAIIGHGGMGKTHLARQVFNANEAKFDVRIWAHVCNKIDQLDLLTEICQSAIDMSGSVINVPTDNKNVPALQSRVKGLSEPSGWSKQKKSCLVVLDDVWQHEDGFGNSQTKINRTQRDEAWKSVLAMLKSLATCKVVMTTRDKENSTRLNADETIVLDGIGKMAMTELLKDIAKPDQPPQGLVERILKLKGSPRAALSIVEKLNIASDSEKEVILHELDDDHHIERLYEDHKLTYHNLPLCLQSCLAFCGMFPYYWRFEREKLTRMWIAHGFIDDTEVKHKLPHQKLTIEYVAEGYFQELEDRSLFKKLSSGRYVIHVHIHSMIRRVCGNYCMSISNRSSEMIVPATVRHLSVTASCLAKLKPGPSLEKTEQVKSNKKSDDEFRMVRTLLVFKDKEGPSAPWTDIREAKVTLKKFKGVRVLDLTDTGVTQLPDSIGKLIHLRYIGFPNSMMQAPPEVNKLLFIQTLCAGSSVDMKSIEPLIEKFRGLKTLIASGAGESADLKPKKLENDAMPVPPTSSESTAAAGIRQPVSASKSTGVRDSPAAPPQSRQPSVPPLSGVSASNPTELPDPTVSPAGFRTTTPFQPPPPRPEYQTTAPLQPPRRPPGWRAPTPLQPPRRPPGWRAPTPIRPPRRPPGWRAPTPFQPPHRPPG